MILLDTSVVIELVERGNGFDECYSRLIAHEARHVHVSAVTIFEVEAGFFEGSPNIRKRRAVWDRLFRLMTYELVTEDVASAAAKIVRDTAKAGKQIGALDALIAATAMEWNLTVCTRDLDFKRVKGLKVDLWR